jgi:hypothetical protein
MEVLSMSHADLVWLLSEESSTISGGIWVLLIEDPGSKIPDANWAAVRQTAFAMFSNAEAYTQQESKVAMSVAVAERMAIHIRTALAAKADYLLVSSPNGKSRATAVTKAIAEAGMGITPLDMESEPNPNPIVYKLMLQALRESMEKMDKTTEIEAYIASKSERSNVMSSDRVISISDYLRVQMRVPDIVLVMQASGKEVVAYGPTAEKLAELIGTKVQSASVVISSLQMPLTEYIALVEETGLPNGFLTLREEGGEESKKEPIELEVLDKLAKTL